MLGSQSKAFSTSACISVFTQKLKETILLPNWVSQREIRLDAGILSILIILNLLFFLPQISLSWGIFASVSELMFLGIDDRNSSILIFLTLVFLSMWAFLLWLSLLPVDDALWAGAVAHLLLTNCVREECCFVTVSCVCPSHFSSFYLYTRAAYCNTLHSTLMTTVRSILIDSRGFISIPRDYWCYWSFPFY